MKREIELLEKIEAYLQGTMPEEERINFELECRENFELDQQVVVHKNFIKQLDELAAHRSLLKKMDAIHNSLDLESLKEEVLPWSARVKTLWKKYKFNAITAASVAVITIVATLFSTGYLSKDDSINSNYSALKREINNIKKSQHALINDIKADGPAGHEDSPEFGGSGFAVSTDGLIVTNNHVVNGAQAVFIQSTSGNSYKAKILYSDPVYDIAVLQVADSSFKAFSSLPYTINKSVADLGSNVYTLGFPKDDPVYGEGYVSSGTGFAGDTTAYQVSIPVNPGNSGGPLLDSHGNIIGIISGKQTQYDGATFAIKSGYLLKSLNAIPADSLSGNAMVFNKRNTLSGLNRRDQIKKIEKYVFLVKVYK